MVILGATFFAGSENREVVGIDLEAVPAAEEFVERSELRVRYLKGGAADLAHEVFVVVVKRDVPSPRLPAAQVDVVDQPDPGQIVEDPVDGRRLYPARALPNVIDDQPSADERLLTRREGANHSPSGKGQAESGFPDPLYQQVFGQDDIRRHVLPHCSKCLLQVIATLCHQGDLPNTPTHDSPNETHRNCPSPGMCAQGTRVRFLGEAIAHVDSYTADRAHVAD